MNQPYVPLPPTSRTSTAAIISLIAGILGFVQILPVIGPIAAVIAGHMAKNEIRKSAGMVSGNGMATAGLILGYVMIALGMNAVFKTALAFFTGGARFGWRVAAGFVVMFGAGLLAMTLLGTGV